MAMNLGKKVHALDLQWGKRVGGSSQSSEKQ